MALERQKNLWQRLWHHAAMVRGIAARFSTSSTFRFLLLIPLWLVVLFTPSLTRATMVIPVAESDLAQHATAIVVGHVIHIASYWDSSARQVFTQITLDVEETLKGEELTGSSLILKQLGGRIGQFQSWIDGSPEFTRGEKVLLFLSQNADGSARVDHLFLGKFSLFIDAETEKELAYRGALPAGVHLLRSARALSEQAPIVPDKIEEFATLKSRVQAVLQQTGSESRAQLVSAFPQLALPLENAIHERFTLIDAIPARWFEPDSRAPIVMQLNLDNAPADAEASIQASLDAWSGVPTSTFRYENGGSTSSAGFRQDDLNVISFGDPLGQIDKPINCSGVLAIGGYFRNETEVHFMHGQKFFRIVEGDLVFADDWEECPFFSAPLNVAEIATHELGHVLGLGHSDNPDAIMFATARFNGRGAFLHPDDIAGLLFLYPDATVPQCSYAVSPKKRTLSGAATAGKISIAAREGCGWTAVSTDPWISITKKNSGSGDGTVIYTVTENTGNTPRRGRITIADRTVIIKQKGGGAPQSRKRVPPFKPG